jgi:hypothetical protein
VSDVTAKAAEPERDAWWTERELGPEEGLRFAVGPLELSIYRQRDEWQIGQELSAEYDKDADPWRVEAISEFRPDPGSLQRFAVRGQRSRLRLTPTMPDRPIVARPRMPLFVPAGEAIQIFTSSPVWLEVAVGDPWRTLLEVPTRRLSDTWVGGSTRDGELAYAIRTVARKQLDGVPVRPYRAITPLVIRNQADDMLAVEHLNLPAPYLSVFATPLGRLWTEAITMLRSESGEMAALEIGRGAPAAAGEAERLTEPRRRAERNLLVRAFSSLLHPFMGGGIDE